MTCLFFQAPQLRLSSLFTPFASHLYRALLLAFPFPLCSALPLNAFAQEAARLDAVTVTAISTPRTQEQLSQPVTVLNRTALENLNANNLGDTLSSVPGVSSSGFAPGAGRPIIRGLEGARVKILENGMGVNDVSSLSPDHRVATETLNATQVEVLRGPATLLYGSGAIGGLVNVVNRRLPLTLPASANLSGNAQVRLGAPANQRSANAELEGSAGGVVWHLDGLTSQASDYRFPGFSIAQDLTSATGRMPNSYFKTQEAGLGASWINDNFLLGASASRNSSNYGVPNEAAYLSMNQNRADLLARLRLSGAVESISVKLASSSYRHNEVELPENQIASTFRSSNNELRVELKHASIAGFAGTVVLQNERRKYSALTPDGEIELVEPTNTRVSAIALVEERDFGPFVLDFGLRQERERHAPVSSDPRSFSLSSGSVGLLWRLAAGYNAAINLVSSQRAPSPSELYTNGPHEGTATFEVGNGLLSKESSRAVDLTLRKTQGAVRGSVSLFTHRFANYIYGQFSDADADGIADRMNDEGVFDPAGELIYLQYGQQAARFKGGEFEVIADTPLAGLTARLFGDTVRASLANGTPLPRITPSRLGLGFNYMKGPLALGTSLTRVASQSRISPLETATPGYTKLDLNASYSVKWQGAKLAFYALLRNATNESIRLHTSFLKDSVPQPGRSLIVGVQAAF